MEALRTDKLSVELDGFALKDISLTVRKGRTTAVLGANEAGKTTLALAILQQLEAKAKVHGKIYTQGNLLQESSFLQTYGRCITLTILLSAALYYTPRADKWYWIPLIFITVFVNCQFNRRTNKPKLGWSSARMRRLGVAYISSEHGAAQELPEGCTIEEVIARDMPISDPEGRRREVIAALVVAGFKMYDTDMKGPLDYINHGVRISHCSGGQRQLIYILAVLASRPKLLIADEILSGLDIDRQVSVLRMLQHLQRVSDLSIIYMTVDPFAARLMAHDAAFLHHGRIVESGPAHTFLIDQYAKCSATRSYLDMCNAVPGRIVVNEEGECVGGGQLWEKMFKSR